MRGMKMTPNKIASDMEKYAPWIRRNKKLAGPIFVVSILYILLYLVVTFYFWSVSFQMTGIQQAGYLLGFVIFIIAIYLAFTGFLLRKIMSG
jgi:hypothetical protein